MSDLEYWVWLGHRMKACKGFKWWFGVRFIQACGEAGMWTFGSGEVVLAGAIPDLRDPGTVGHALAMMREALGCPFAHTAGFMEGGMAPDGPVWSVFRDWSVRVPLGEGTTEAEAIIKAWETVQ